ncbi:hypothetical protein D7Y41_21975 [Anaerotruncus sp. 1XD22-93]|nr:hypothetical protein [Anaerotruncus sp. 1XD42-93]RKJ83949.1 hypothetical protein D7Y41_21975 [Anaerotruncus sp. 1XD22-93]
MQGGFFSCKRPPLAASRQFTRKTAAALRAAASVSERNRCEETALSAKIGVHRPTGAKRRLLGRSKKIE